MQTYLANYLAFERIKKEDLITNELVMDMNGLTYAESHVPLFTKIIILWLIEMLYTATTYSFKTHY